MIGAYQNFFWNTFWGIFADRSSFYYCGFFYGADWFWQRDQWYCKHVERWETAR